MRVSVASFTGTHPLDLARELGRMGALERYYCALPRMWVTGLPRGRVSTHPLVLFPQVALRKAGMGALEPHLHWPMTEAYDRWLARTIGPCDVFHVLSSYGLRAMRRAKTAFGAMTVCDHGSSHIRTQARILCEEAELCGVRIRNVDPRFIEKEEIEYGEADAVFVPSAFSRQSFIEQGIDPAKVTAIPYGARLEEYFPVPKRDAVFRVLCVAQLSVRKGIRYLLEATSRLALPNSEVVLRGGEARETRTMLAPYRGEYRLQPPVARHQLRDLYSQASLLVLPSIEDGFGLVIAQAMACGVPVIATTNTGGPDVIDNGVNGFIVPIEFNVSGTTPVQQCSMIVGSGGFELALRGPIEWSCPNEPPPPPATAKYEGKGAGHLTGSRKINFEFHARWNKNLPSGQCNVQDDTPKKGRKIHCLDVTELFMSGDELVVRGNALDGKTPTKYEIRATDYSKPNAKNSLDTFSITTETLFSAGSSVSMGDVRISEVKD